MKRAPDNRTRTDQTFFVTFAVEGRQPVFRDSVLVEKFLSTLQHFRREQRVLLFGYVVMPDHVHFICRVINGMTISSLVRRIKTFTSHSESFSWQTRFWSAAIDYESLLVQKLNYMHANPVRAGLVTDESEYPWSSWSEYYVKDKFEFIDQY